MSIHDCPHTFEELARVVLPAHMTRMRLALRATEPMSAFSEKGVGARSLLVAKQLEKDFSGCYVLVEGSKPIYVGISRGVIGRLRQHVYGKTHFDASLAFRIAMERHPVKTIAKRTRSEAMRDPLFGTSFSEALAYIKTLHVAYIEVKNPLELYVFEPYCAIELDTHQWNSFATH